MRSKHAFLCEVWQQAYILDFALAFRVEYSLCLHHQDQEGCVQPVQWSVLAGFAVTHKAWIQSNVAVVMMLGGAGIS